MDAILPYALVPELPNVYVCGCFERWVSIYLQSVRGLNLAWALVESGRVQRGAEVAVIGGGFAGLEAAAGLGRLGVSVTLVEQNPNLLATQRNNRVRSIHPHIHEWPRPGALEPRAGLPLLDWSAGISAQMAAEVLGAFELEVARSRIHVECGARPVTLQDGDLNSVKIGEPSEARRDASERAVPARLPVQIGLRGADPRRFDAVILALGVGVEKSFGKLPLKSYWSDDSIAEIRPGLRHHLVTGIGEGGVIDALYLRLAKFSHAEIAARLAEIPGMRAVEDTLVEIERALEGKSDSEANAFLDERYRALPVPPEVDALLGARARKDTRVTLNGPEAHPLAARADILNRFLISRLVAMGELGYRPGKIVDLAPDGDGFVAQFSDGDSLRTDEVEIRHGTVPSLKAGFPTVWERYQPMRVGLPHLTPTPTWPNGYFER